VLVEPRVEQVSMFAFDQTPALLAEGYRATAEALDAMGASFCGIETGLHPRRRVRVRVDDARCVGCGLCVKRAPHVFQPTPSGKVHVVAPEHIWSPLDGDYVRDCPTLAITAEAPEALEASDDAPPTAA
jgi:ferredoxin